MSKKQVKHEETEADTQPVKVTGDVHLKVLADLLTPEKTYLQGEVIEVESEEAVRLQRDHAGYFEVLP